MYDPIQSRMIHSRDVLFNEFTRGIEKERIEEKKQLELSLSNSSEEEPMINEDERVAGQFEEETHNEPVNISEPEPVTRRSTRERKQPDKYGVWVNAATIQNKEPLTVNEALNSSVERYKARLVAQGFTQKPGLDYDETFCPVVRFESLRTLAAMAVQDGLILHQMDVTSAFLNGTLSEEVYMKQPEGFIEKGKENLVCKLKHNIYGLKQSPRCWNATLDRQLRHMGFIQSTSDPCIYTASEGEAFIIGVYVDDIILAGKSEKKMADIKKALSDKFEMKDLGELHYFLGVKVIQDRKKGNIWIGQPVYTKNILQKFGMENAKPISTPVAVNTKLTLKTEDSEYFDKETYQSAVGSLLYLSTRTRPDITFAVNNIARFSSNPTTQHWTAVKRIFRYLKGTIHLGLLYERNGLKKLIIGYSDADWGGDCNDHKSTSGYLFLVGGTAVSWRSNKQTCVALSTAEAEYMALASAAQEAVWMRQLSKDMKTDVCEPTVIFEDNQSAICMAKNPQLHGRAKHIGIKYHFIREQVSNNTIKLRYCRTEDMIADIFTKGLSQEKFVKLRSMCGLHSINQPVYN